MLKIKQFICKYIFGHKTSTDYNDSGYLICKRCGSHEFYDYPMFNSVPLFYVPKYLFRLISNKCQTLKINNNNNTLPF